MSETTAARTKTKINPLKGSNLEGEVDLSALRHLADGEKPPPGAVVWRVLTKQDGDKRLVWDRGDFADMAGARQVFNDLVEKGMVPYVCDERGQPTGDVMREFDPTAGEVVFAPVGLARGG